MTDTSICAGPVIADGNGHSVFCTRLSDAENSAPEDGTYVEIIEGKDWGAAVTKLIIPLADVTGPGRITEDVFKVTLKSSIMGPVQRTIDAAYMSDGFVTLELSSGPADTDSNLFQYNPEAGFNTWKRPYEFKIESPLFSIPAEKCRAAVCPALDGFTFKKITDGNITLSCAYFEPRGAGRKPLVIWLHGAGEGGTDPTVPLMANRAAGFASAETQRIFGGNAYVLVPQTPRVWMTTGGVPYDISDTTERTKSSMYTGTVKRIIDMFIAGHPDIDTDRIYIGGASNGGYMTVNMLLNYPGFFAAAFPVCEAYPDSWISDKQIAQLSKEHIWFTAAATDTVVPPESYMISTVKRLRAAGAGDIHESCFGKVVDTSGRYRNPDGSPYEYQGHWSWIYMLNNECRDDGVDILHWLAGRKKQQIAIS